MQRKSLKKIDFHKNIKLYYSAVGVIILGYIFLSIGDANSITSLTVGPIVLVLGYLVIMPIALLAGIGKKEGESEYLPDSDVKTQPPKNKKST